MLQLYVALLEIALALVLLWIPVRDGKFRAAIGSLESRPKGTVYTPASGEARDMRSAGSAAHAAMRLVAAALLVFAFVHLARFLSAAGWI